MSKRKKDRMWIMYGLLVALIALQAVSGLISGNIFYVNYKNQPLNSFGALIVVAAFLIAGMVLLWRRLKGRGKNVVGRESARSRRDGRSSHREKPGHRPARTKRNRAQQQ